MKNQNGYVRNIELKIGLFDSGLRVERFIAFLLTSLSFGHITATYPISLTLHPNTFFYVQEF